MYKIIFSLMFFSVVAYGEITLEEVREAIKEKGANWTAGSTSVSILPPEQQKFLCGLRIEPLPPDVPMYESPKGILYPDSLDWRCYTYNGHTDANWVTPIRYQGICGACWAFAVLGVVEAKMNVCGGVPDPTQNLAEQYLVSTCFPSGTCKGGTFGNTCNFVKNYGVPDEDCFPYEGAGDSLAHQIPCSDRCSNWEQRIVKISSYGGISNSVNSVKGALMDGPVVGGLDVYEDFLVYTGGIYERTSGAYENAHAIIIIGWNNRPYGHWICKNSWSPYWGEDGYFRIKWGQCSINAGSVYIGTPSGAAPKIRYVSTEISEVTGDSDGVLNPGEQVDLITTLENVPAYKTATSVTGILSTTSSDATMIDNTGSYPDIPGGSTGANSSNRFRVTFSETLTVVPFTLGVTATSYFTELGFSLKTSFDQAGWPAGIGQVRSSPLILDLDGDAQNEVIFGTDGGAVYVKNILGEDESGFPFQATGKIWGSAAVGDVNNNNELEIVVGSWEDTVYIIKKNGTILTRKALGNRILATPVLSDLDGDGDLEIIVGGYDGYLYVFHHNGADYPGFPYLLASGAKVFSGVAVGYIDGDAVKDIVVGCTNKNVYAVSSNGSPLSGWPFLAGGSIQGVPSIVDSSNPKIAVGSSDKKLYLIDAGGNEIFNVLAGGQIKGSPSFVDLDSNGEAELVFGSSDGNVYVYKGKNPFPGWPQSVGGGIDGELSFADLNNNGYPEIIVTTTGGHLWIYDKDGTLLKYFPMYSEASTLTPPAIEDIDKDGDLEVVFGSNAGVHIIDIKSQGSNDNCWNMYRCNPHRTGYYGGKFVAIEEEKPLPLVYSLSHSCPNPLDRRIAQIEYTLSKPSPVRLSIYNSVGQELTTLVSELQSSGAKSVQWDAHKVPSGIYFYKLRAGEFECTRKIVILK